MVNANLAGLTDYPFQRLRDLLDCLETPEGLEPLTLSIGEPQHQPPSFVGEVIQANGHLFNKYPPIAGTPELRGAIRDYLTRRYALKPGFIEEDHILAANGTREALYMIGTLLLDAPKGADAKSLVLLPNPFYQVYVGAAVMNNATPVYLSAGPDNGFLPDLSAIREEMWQGAKILFLCSPGNPQGMSAERAYLKQALELCRRHDVTLVMDECYAEIYGETKPVGALEVAEESGSLDNLLVFQSLSKRSNAAGLRSGFVAGDPKLIKSFFALRNYAGAAIPLPLQAASAALWADDDHVVENRRLYQMKFDAADAMLKGRLGYYRPHGGFFLWLDVRDHFEDGEACARAFWQKAAVRVLPGAYLAKDDVRGHNPGAGYVRIALVHEQPIVEEALRRIESLL